MKNKGEGKKEKKIKPGKKNSCFNRPCLLHVNLWVADIWMKPQGLEMVFYVASNMFHVAIGGGGLPRCMGGQYIMLKLKKSASWNAHSWR